MANGWTPERRARQAALIRNWKPWQQATGPRSDEGKARVARNSYKGGQWLKLRELTKSMNALLRDQRDQLSKVLE